MLNSVFSGLATLEPAHVTLLPPLLPTPVGDPSVPNEFEHGSMHTRRNKIRQIAEPSQNTNTISAWQSSYPKGLTMPTGKFITHTLNSIRRPARLEKFQHMRLHVPSDLLKVIVIPVML